MLYLIFSLLSYLCGMSAIVFAFWFMEFRLDSTNPAFNWMDTVQNALLFLVFPLQHSLMARKTWKSWISLRIHPLMERPMYVGISGIALWIVMWFWKPFGPLLFKVNPRFLFDALFLLSLLLIVWTSFSIGHFKLFGIRHGIAAWRNAPWPAERLTESGPFRRIRHPLTSFLILAVWSHHSLTASRLEWNLLITAYSLIGVLFEERDLVNTYGDAYREYRRRVPAFIPKIL